MKELSVKKSLVKKKPAGKPEKKSSTKKKTTTKTASSSVEAQPTVSFSPCAFSLVNRFITEGKFTDRLTYYRAVQLLKVSEYGRAFLGDGACLAKRDSNIVLFGLTGLCLARFNPDGSVFVHRWHSKEDREVLNRFMPIGFYDRKAMLFSGKRSKCTVTRYLHGKPMKTEFVTDGVNLFSNGTVTTATFSWQS